MDVAASTGRSPLLRGNSCTKDCSETPFLCRKRYQDPQALGLWDGCQRQLSLLGPKGAERSVWGWNETSGLFHNPLELQCHRAGLPLHPLLLQVFPAAFPFPWDPGLGTGISCVSEPWTPFHWKQGCAALWESHEQTLRARSSFPPFLPTPSKRRLSCLSRLVSIWEYPQMFIEPPQGTGGKGLPWLSLLGWAAGAGGEGAGRALVGRCSPRPGAAEGREGVAWGVLLIFGYVLCNFSQIPAFSVGSCWNELTFHPRTTTVCVYAGFSASGQVLFSPFLCSDTTHGLFVCVFQVLEFFRHFLSI